MDMKWFLFSFEGRINRKPFWLYFLAFFVLIITLESLTGDLASQSVSTPTAIVIFLALWPNLAIQAKRWHDTDRSAWWVLINFVPIIGGLWSFIVTGFFSGTSGDNRFGPDPLA